MSTRTAPSPPDSFARRGHALLDAGLRWQANSALALALALRNVLAADYEDAVGFPAPGRTLWLSVQLRI